MKHSIIEIAGFILLWAATAVGRKRDNQIKLMSKQWWGVLLLITIGVLLITSCSSYEQLERCSGYDRVITGYSKNMKHYKVVDDCDNSRPSIKIEGDTIPVGGVLILKDEFRHIKNL